jgi:hypothetical protein
VGLPLPVESRKGYCWSKEEDIDKEGYSNIKWNYDGNPSHGSYVAHVGIPSLGLDITLSTWMVLMIN